MASIGDSELSRALNSLQRQIDDLTAIVRNVEAKVAEWGPKLKDKGVI